MRVSKELQVFDLPFNATDHVPTYQLLPGDDFEGDLLAGHPMDSKFDLSERTLAQGTDDIICADPLLELHLLATLVH